MLGHTGYWSSSQYLADQKRRLAEEQRRQKERRRKHRSLTRRERLIAALEHVRERLMRLEKLNTPNRVAKYGGEDKVKRESKHLLRRWNKLVEALNDYVGTSQKVALEEV